MPNPATLPLLLALLCQDPGTAPAGDGGHWPYGPSSRSGPLAGSDRKDLWNLGILGAKAWDADKPLPEAPTGGRRRFGSSRGERGQDEGPERLRIEALMPDGPAARAGLALGDVVVGVGRKRFDGGFVGPLARALVDAESAKTKNVVKLLVERDGKVDALDVQVPGGGKEMDDPAEGKARRKLFDGALAWLAARQQDDGGIPAGLGSSNGRVVTTSLAGLAWIAGGSTLEAGPHKDALARARDFVVKGLQAKDPLGELRPGGDNWDQSNWAYAHAGIFLGELWHVSKDQGLAAELQQVATTLGKRQEQSGGYAHGPGGPNALGYLELNIMAGFVLSSLGLARQAGCEVDDKVVDRLLAYLEESSGGGGVGYSTAPGQQGQGNIGRTAGAWLGAVACGRSRSRFVGQMRSFVERNVDKPFEGHATLMQHILLAGLASQALGRKAEQRYWKVMERELVLARAPDGSFQPRPWHESLTMESNSDVTLGEGWTTACWALVLAPRPAKDQGLAAWLGKAR